MLLITLSVARFMHGVSYSNSLVSNMFSFIALWTIITASVINNCMELSNTLYFKCIADSCVCHNFGITTDNVYRVVQF